MPGVVLQGLDGRQGAEGRIGANDRGGGTGLAANHGTGSGDLLDASEGARVLERLRPSDEELIARSKPVSRSFRNEQERFP